MQNMKFIGRQKEIEFLTKWVVDKNARPIVYIHDELEEAENKGGIGKTWLLREVPYIDGTTKTSCTCAYHRLLQCAGS